MDLSVEFCFLDAEVLRNVNVMADYPDGLPRMQELQKRRDATPWLVWHSLTMRDACAGRYREQYCAVSHRWEQPGQPDPDRVQYEAIRSHVVDNHAIRYVWFECTNGSQSRGLCVAITASALSLPGGSTP